MNNRITFDQTIQRFREHNMPYKVMELGDNFRIVVASRGGRVFGPFDGNDESILWMNKSFQSKEKFQKFLDSKEFHIGGERMWVGPELELFCDAPELFDETYTVQPALDPGNFTMQDAPYGGVTVGQDVKMSVLRNGSDKSFYFSRTFSAAANPLTYMKQLKDVCIRYCGFSQDIYLKDMMPETKMYLDPWVLTQVNPGGRVIVPFFGEPEFDDYYEPTDETVHRVCNGYAELNTNGCRKFKTAYKAANTFGRMGHVNKLNNGNYYLMIRNYYNDPSIPYSSEPWDDLGKRGCSMYFYNDDGSNGGFAEFENSCAMIGLDSNRDESYSTTSLWFFVGKKEDLQRIIKVMLGINYTIEI